MGLRHLSNGDAYKRTKFLSNSIDYSKRKESRQDMGATKSQITDLDQRNEDFRIKKNLTNNADRIIGGNSMATMTPATNSSKYEEIKRASQDFINGGSAVTKSPETIKGKVLIPKYGKENQNQNNVRFAQVPKETFKEPAGGYNAASIKRSLGFSPTIEGNLVRLTESPSRSGISSGGRAGMNSSITNMNDLSYHRAKYINTYGFDVLTGVRKESPNRLL